ncbi:MAG: proteasome assembly chaperone 4 family protein [Nitrosopumilus sp.]
MDSPNDFFQRTVNLESHSFSLRIQKFENGYFISVTEGINKIGSIVASMNSRPNPITTTIIPAKTDSLFLKLVSERISTKFQCIVLFSMSIQTKLDTTTVKSLMSEIMEMIDND